MKIFLAIYKKEIVTIMILVCALTACCHNKNIIPIDEEKSIDINQMEEDNKVYNPIESGYFYLDIMAEESFSSEFIDELKNEFKRNNVKSFFDTYSENVKKMTNTEILSYVNADPILFRFHEEIGESYDWFLVDVVPDKNSTKDIVVNSEEEKYVFRLWSNGEAEKGIPIYGQQMYFINWEDNRFIISLDKINTIEKIRAYLFTDPYENIMVFEKTEDGNIETRFYRFTISDTAWPEDAYSIPE